MFMLICMVKIGNGGDLLLVLAVFAPTEQGRQREVSTMTMNALLLCYMPHILYFCEIILSIATNYACACLGCSRDEFISQMHEMNAKIRY